MAKTFEVKENVNTSCNDDYCTVNGKLGDYLAFNLPTTGKFNIILTEDGVNTTTVADYVSKGAFTHPVSACVFHIALQFLNTYLD